MRRLLIFICCATLLLGQKPVGRVRIFQSSPAPAPPPPPLPPPDPLGDLPPLPDIPMPDDPPLPFDDPFSDIPEPPFDIPWPDPPDLPPDDPELWEIPPPDFEAADVRPVKAALTGKILLRPILGRSKLSDHFATDEAGTARDENVHARTIAGMRP